MMGLIQLGRVEVLKWRRTPLYWIHLLLPLAGGAVFLAYYAISGWDPASEVQAYLEVTAGIWPFVCGMVCAMSVELEEVSRFQSFFGLPQKRYHALLVKWMSLLAAGFFSGMLGCVGFGLVYRQMDGGAVYPLKMYLEAAVVLWLGQTVLYLWHLCLSLRFGKPISIGLGLVESVWSMLFLTGLGEGRWMFFPWCWSGRWCDHLLSYNRTGGGHAAFWQGNVPAVFAICAGIAVLLTAAAFLWFWKFEGRRQQE